LQFDVSFTDSVTDIGCTHGTFPVDQTSLSANGTLLYSFMDVFGTAIEGAIATAGHTVVRTTGYRN
jgi:hypothetical protein